MQFSFLEKLTNPAFSVSMNDPHEFKQKNGFTQRGNRRFSMNFVNADSLNLMKNKTERIFSSLAYRYGLDSNVINSIKVLLYT